MSTVNIFDMADEWNDANETFTAIKMDVTDTASDAGSNLLDLQVGGAPAFRVGKGAGAFFESDLIEQRRSTNPQAFMLYNTYTDASNFERGFMRWDSNLLQIGTEAGGTGTDRVVELLSGGNRLGLGVAGIVRANITTSALAPNGTRDLGATATPWQDLFVSRNINATGLPTSDPGVNGRVWNDGGTLKVSAG